MSDLSRIQRRVLRQAVRDNVAVLAGPAVQMRNRRPSRATLTVLALGLAAAIAGSTALILDARGDGGAALVPAAAVDPAGPGPRPPAPDPAARYSAPSPIDRDVFPLAVRRVVLDPGHGGRNTGTLAPRLGVEKEIALDIAERVRRLLEAEGFSVVMTRDSDVDVELAERARIANEARGDIFVSIHLNWIPERGTRGVETFFLGPTDDPFLEEFAAQENRDSGYSLSDLRQLLEGVYADARREESRRLAETVQSELYGYLSRINPEVENWGVKTAPFVVLIETGMPAILAEVACLSHEDEARRLADSNYRQYIALALYNGVRGYARAVSRTFVEG